MGIAVTLAEMIIREHLHRPIEGKLLLIGRQTVNLSRQEALEKMAEFGIDTGGIAIDDLTVDTSTVRSEQQSETEFITDDSFFRLLGVTDIEWLDHSDYEGANIIHDLNTPIPDELDEYADFIIDGSTFDNVFNPGEAMRNVSRLMKPGGRLFTINQASNHHLPYLIFTAHWFLDYFVMNRYADAKIYHVLLIPGNPWIFFSFDYDTLTKDAADVHNIVVEYEMGIVAFAEKGADSTWDVIPNQQHYRSDEEWAVFEENLKLLKASKRPYHGYNKLDPGAVGRMHGYVFLPPPPENR